jgi:hypothetical protein
MKTLLFGLVGAAFILLSCNYAKADCPTDIPGTGTWTESQTIMTLPGGCQVWVDYCQRQQNDGSWQIYINSITPLSGCDDVDYSTIIRQTVDVVMESVTATPCTGGTTEVTIIRGTCFRLSSNPGGYPIAVLCPGVYCEKTCTVCHDIVTNTNQVTGCTSTNIGTADCQAQPQSGLYPSGSGLPIGGSCYLVPCNTN